MRNFVEKRRQMDQATARQEAIAAYNRSFDLLDLAERTAVEDAELIAAAWTSRHRWMVAGGTKEVVIADWMISRVAAALAATSPGFAQLSVDMAKSALAGAGEDIDDWLQASLAEGMARAALVAGDATEGARWLAEAERLLQLIGDEEDKSVIDAQIADLRPKK
jgi:hypothetical protein